MSRCSVKMTSFWRGEGVGGGMVPATIRGGVFGHLIGDGRGRKNDAEQARQLAPLAVLAAAAHGAGERFKTPEGGDLGLQLVDGARGGRLIQDLLFSGFHLVVWGLLQVLHVFGVQGGYGGGHRHGRRAPLEQLQLAATLLQAFAAAAERLVDGLGRGREPSLQDGQRKAHGAGTLVVLERFSTIEFLTHVVRDGLVELRFGVGEPVGHGVGDTLREQRRAVKLAQVLLDHAAHQVRDLHLVHAIAEAALKAVAVEQGEEELKILLLAVVGRGGHQQKVPRQGSEQLPELVAPGVFDLTAEEGRGEFVRLVTDHQVPAAVRGLELLLHVLVARELVQAGNDEVIFQEPVAGARRFQLVVGQDVKGQLETPVEFVLPLFGQAARADDEAALQIAADDQLLDEQPRHDRLAGARVVGQQETQRLARQHRLVDRRDLVRERVDKGRVDGEHRVEQMRQADAMRFGHEPEQMAVAVEAPGAALLDHVKARFVVAIQQLVGDPAGRVLVGQFQCLRAKPLHTDDGDEGIREDAAHGGVGLEVFERAHASSADCLVSKQRLALLPFPSLSFCVL